MTAEQIRAAGQAAVTPAQSLAIALAAVHAACPKAIRELTLTTSAPVGAPDRSRPATSASTTCAALSRNGSGATASCTEPLAADGDPLHLALVFNIDHTNAMAYANAARNLLSSPAGQVLSCRPE